MISDPVRNETMDNLLTTIYQTADRTDMPTHQIVQSKMNLWADEIIWQIDEMVRRTDERNQRTDEMIRRADEIIRQTDEMNPGADGSRRRMDEMNRRADEMNRRADEMNRRMDEMIREADERMRRMDEMILEDHERIRRTDERVGGTDEMIRKDDEINRQRREPQQRPIRDSRSGYYESIKGHVLRICEAIRKLFSKILSLFRIIH